MTTYCSKSFEIIFWSLSLFNTYIQHYPSSSLKISPAIFHDADCHDFDLSNEENAHHISMHACPDTMVWWTSQPFFCSPIVCSLMLSPVFLCGYLAMHGYLVNVASIFMALCTWSCSWSFTSSLANYLSIK